MPDYVSHVKLTVRQFDNSVHIKEKNRTRVFVRWSSCKWVKSEVILELVETLSRLSVAKAPCRGDTVGTVRAGNKRYLPQEPSN